MKLSILVMAYNVEKYIAEALDSIVMQKVNFSYEILIGNDGSSDGTVEILKEYEKKYPEIIKLFLTKRITRSGSGDYLNFANLFANAKGEYFCVLDGDDFWSDENKLQKQINFLDQNHDYTVCGHNYWLLYEDGKMVKSYDEEKDKTNYTFVAENLEDLLLRHKCPYMQTSSLIYRNVFANDLEMKNKFLLPMYSADLIRTLLHAKEGKVKYLKDLMSCYRISSSGVWSYRSEIEQINQHINFFTYHKKNSFDKKYGEIFDAMILLYLQQLLQKIRGAKVKYIKTLLKTKILILKSNLILKRRALLKFLKSHN